MYIAINRLDNGKVYRFPYNGKTRVALVLEADDKLAECWDFSSDDFRKFSYSKIGEVEIIDDQVLVLNDWDHEQLNWYDKKGFSYKEYNGRLYIADCQ